MKIQKTLKNQISYHLKIIGKKKKNTSKDIITTLKNKEFLLQDLACRKKIKNYEYYKWTR